MAGGAEGIGAADGQVVFPGLERLTAELGVVGEGVGE